MYFKRPQETERIGAVPDNATRDIVQTGNKTIVWPRTTTIYSKIKGRMEGRTLVLFLFAIVS